MNTRTVRTVVIAPPSYKRKYKPLPPPPPPKSILAQIFETVLGIAILAAILFGMHACQSSQIQTDQADPGSFDLPRVPSGYVLNSSQGIMSEGVNSCV